MPRPDPIEVPRLDLAPKLNRPLSLRNPLDYLRLLYWVFYFPQALRWYISPLVSRSPHENDFKFSRWKMTFQLEENPIYRRIFTQAIILVLLSTILLAFGAQESKITSFPSAVTSASIGLFGAFIGFFLALPETNKISRVTKTITHGCLGGVLGIAFSVNWPIRDELITITENPLLIEILFPLLSIIACFIFLASLLALSGFVLFGIYWISKFFSYTPLPDTTKNLLKSVLYGIAIPLNDYTSYWAEVHMILTIISLYIVPYESFPSNLGVPAFLFILIFFLMRLDAWILGMMWSLSGKLNEYPSVSSTFLPIPLIQRKMRFWLRYDWDRGAQNANEIITFTFQWFPVIQALKHELGALPLEQLLCQMSQLLEKPYGWRLIYLISTDSSPFDTPARKRNWQLTNPASAASAGFWLLYEGKAEKAVEAFRVVEYFLHGKEMLVLAETLAVFQQAKTVSEIVAIEVPEYPRAPLLRPVTWKTMQRFCHVISDTKIVVGSVSRTSKAFASNRALGELKHVLNHLDEVSEAERQLIEDIATQWRNALLDVATSVGEQTIDAPVQNPYIIGDPVEGSLFVGREDVLRQLEELWLMGRQMQSVVLYGHRRMGKTSILRNAAKTVGAGLRLVYVNMLRSASAESISDVLLAITDELAAVMNVPPPSDADMMAQPTRTCDRYLKRILDSLNDNETLVIAIDEFEKIEELIDTGKLSPDFIAYLRGLVQMSPKLGFAFAGLHTLEEMTQDYFNPFFASVIPIKVGFLKPGAVNQLLANPAGEFLLDYDRAALDRIYQLTSGQPYLTQLVGFQLVRRYNDLVFEQGNERSAIFTVEDVDIVTTDLEFFQRGRYYFTGVWDQAGRDVPEQRPVLTALAPHPDGLSLEALAQATALNQPALIAALTRLERHDVVTVEHDHARIRVELFRRWLLQQLDEPRVRP